MPSHCKYYDISSQQYYQQMYLTKGIYLWLVLSSLIVIWDASYVLLRPHSMKDGSLFNYFSPYHLYIQFDTLYGNLTDRFVVIQSWLNLVEITIALASVIISALGRKHSTKLVGAMMAVIVSAFTFWKTVIYIWYADVHLTAEAHAFSTRSIFSFYIPTVFWIILPLYTIYKVPMNIITHTIPITDKKKK